jgi:acyl-CoA synthetase (AMP-forming)/AMP-acid ligase II
MRVALTVADFLNRAALVYGHRTAVVDEPGVPGSLGAQTYAELEARARGMALALDELGVEHGERVAIVSPNSGRFLTAFFGVSGYGRILVPINFRLSAGEIAYIVEHSGASVLLYDPELAGEVDTVKVVHKFCLDGVEDTALFAPAPEGASPAPWEPDEDATCSVNYTSGTTARPKGVQMTHRNCWLNAAAFGWHTGVSDRDVLLHTLPMFHCNGWGMPYAVTGMGGGHVVLRKVDGEEILARIERRGVTLLCGAPAVVAAILSAAEARSAEGRTVPGRGTVRMVVAGAPPPSKTIERIETELGWEFIQIYGLTETAPLLTINRAPGEWDELDPGTRSQLLSRAGTPAIGVQMDVDVDGEVLARSNHVFAGYWEQPEESAAALEGGWFHTGDGGHLDGAYVVISDRKKDVIITGGENVSSIEVEDCLYQHAAVAEVAVIGVPDEKWGETIKALVVVREDHVVSEAELIAHCRDRLAHFKAPTSVEWRDALDRTATGKLQKYKLRQPYWAGRDRRVN